MHTLLTSAVATFRRVCRGLRLYNGLITLPHFREPLSRWRRLLSNLTAHRRARRLGVFRSYCKPRDRTLCGRLEQRSFTRAFRFPLFSAPLFFQLLAEVIGIFRRYLFMSSRYFVKGCTDCFLSFYAITRSNISDASTSL